MNRDFTGLTADKILGNPVQDSYSWHVFQALSWIDYAKRNKAPSAIHYAAFELRYGIEYLLFQLLVLKNKFLTRTDYEKCIGDPREMKRRLANLGTNYQKLAEFTEMLLSLDLRLLRFDGHWLREKV